MVSATVIVCSAPPITKEIIACGVPVIEHLARARADHRYRRQATATARGKRARGFAATCLWCPLRHAKASRRARRRQAREAESSAAATRRQLRRARLRSPRSGATDSCRHRGCGGSKLSAFRAAKYRAVLDLFGSTREGAHRLNPQLLSDDCGGFNWSTQHLLILLDWEVSDGGECTDDARVKLARA